MTSRKPKQSSPLANDDEEYFNDRSPLFQVLPTGDDQQEHPVDVRAPAEPGSSNSHNYPHILSLYPAHSGGDRRNPQMGSVSRTPNVYEVSTDSFSSAEGAGGSDSEWNSTRKRSSSKRSPSALLCSKLRDVIPRLSRLPTLLTLILAALLIVLMVVVLSTWTIAESSNDDMWDRVTEAENTRVKAIINQFSLHMFLSVYPTAVLFNRSTQIDFYRERLCPYLCGALNNTDPTGTVLSALSLTSPDRELYIACTWMWDNVTQKPGLTYLVGTADGGVGYFVDMNTMSLEMPLRASYSVTIDLKNSIPSLREYIRPRYKRFIEYAAGNRSSVDMSDWQILTREFFPVFTMGYPVRDFSSDNETVTTTQLPDSAAYMSVTARASAIFPRAPSVTYSRGLIVRIGNYTDPFVIANNWGQPNNPFDTQQDSFTPYNPLISTSNEDYLRVSQISEPNVREACKRIDFVALGTDPNNFQRHKFTSRGAPAIVIAQRMQTPEGMDVAVIRTTFQSNVSKWSSRSQGTYFALMTGVTIASALVFVVVFYFLTYYSISQPLESVAAHMNAQLPDGKGNVVDADNSISSERAAENDVPTTMKLRLSHLRAWEVLDTVDAYNLIIFQCSQVRKFLVTHSPDDELTPDASANSNPQHRETNGAASTSLFAGNSSRYAPYSREEELFNPSRSLGSGDAALGSKGLSPGTSRSSSLNLYTVPATVVSLYFPANLLSHPDRAAAPDAAGSTNDTYRSSFAQDLALLTSGATGLGRYRLEQATVQAFEMIIKTVHHLRGNVMRCEPDAILIEFSLSARRELRRTQRQRTGGRLKIDLERAAQKDAKRATKLLSSMYYLFCNDTVEGRALQKAERYAVVDSCQLCYGTFYSPALDRVFSCYLGRCVAVDLLPALPRIKARYLFSSETVELIRPPNPKGSGTASSAGTSFWFREKRPTDLQHKRKPQTDAIPDSPTHQRVLFLPLVPLCVGVESSRGHYTVQMNQALFSVSSPELSNSVSFLLSSNSDVELRWHTLYCAAVSSLLVGKYRAALRTLRVAEDAEPPSAAVLQMRRLVSICESCMSTRAERRPLMLRLRFSSTSDPRSASHHQPPGLYPYHPLQQSLMSAGQSMASSSGGYDGLFGSSQSTSHARVWSPLIFSAVTRLLQQQYNGCSVHKISSRSRILVVGPAPFTDENGHQWRPSLLSLAPEIDPYALGFEVLSSTGVRAISRYFPFRCITEMDGEEVNLEAFALGAVPTPSDVLATLHTPHRDDMSYIPGHNHSSMYVAKYLGCNVTAGGVIRVVSQSPSVRLPFIMNGYANYTIPKVALRIQFLTTLAALVELHQKNIAYGFLFPQAIRVCCHDGSAQFMPTLSDLLRARSELRATRTAFRSPEEVCDGASRTSPASDMFSYALMAAVFAFGDWQDRLPWRWASHLTGAHYTQEKLRRTLTVYHRFQRAFTTGKLTPNLPPTNTRAVSSCTSPSSSNSTFAATHLIHPELYTLLQRCLDTDPTKRPSALDIYQWLDTHTAEEVFYY